ncbi:hypothetical protein TVAG_485070 [Trichomonas vaginalis G3]|uniref:Uncharacterized protein n=1 Tax=Trichomonas vaginalis (strain ATCC PRA-98 / G3) TaxID=412133 RepID=A2EZ23_TRIV3|nr:hypothetical protein TVAGG3_0753960 [Trichomonas vaginalis G3]EAY02072.1 hypothetical protein TVAG_485070 [Trichomonas vaginalis G3]KAI5512736.1 hypothetical protein TVAGG3_0753960 [Trichomonas vaginalis G3]|eukprot:XP_001330525.1 hypothetical protein [Trichomonas vaginalis G3]
MNKKPIIYEKLKIKSIKNIVIPKAFEPLLAFEDHFYSLNEENFEETTKFFEQFIREGPGETPNDNFQYIFQFFKKDSSDSDILYFRILQTLGKIFKPELSTNNTNNYKLARKAGIDVSYPEEEKIFDSSDDEENDISDELIQIIRNDDVSKFQQYILNDNSKP